MKPYFCFDFTLCPPTSSFLETLPENIPLINPKPKTDPKNLCPYKIPTVKEIIKRIDSASCLLYTSKVSSAITINNTHAMAEA